MYLSAQSVSTEATQVINLKIEEDGVPAQLRVLPYDRLEIKVPTKTIPTFQLYWRDGQFQKFQDGIGNEKIANRFEAIDLFSKFFVGFPNAMGFANEYFETVFPEGEEDKYIDQATGKPSGEDKDTEEKQDPSKTEQVGEVVIDKKVGRYIALYIKGANTPFYTVKMEQGEFVGTIKSRQDYITLPGVEKTIGKDEVRIIRDPLEILVTLQQHVGVSKAEQLLEEIFDISGEQEQRELHRIPEDVPTRTVGEYVVATIPNQLLQINNRQGRSVVHATLSGSDIEYRVDGKSPIKEPVTNAPKFVKLINELLGEREAAVVLRDVFGIQSTQEPIQEPTDEVSEDPSDEDFSSMVTSKRKGLIMKKKAYSEEHDGYVEEYLRKRYEFEGERIDIYYDLIYKYSIDYNRNRDIEDIDIFDIKLIWSGDKNLDDFMYAKDKGYDVPKEILFESLESKEQYSIINELQELVVEKHHDNEDAKGD